MSAPRVGCPTCKRELVWSEEFPWRPFCSERCKMVDLGAWFAEERAIAAAAPDTLEKDEK
ncbi:MAG: DNA gyrase inhibitor YacG [Pseudomonadota bacterium]